MTKQLQTPATWRSFPELEVERLLYREGGWDLDALDGPARDSLVGDLINRYLLEGYPELQKFEE